MPELPEVEIARSNLARWTVGRRIAGVALHHADIVASGDPHRLEEATFVAWERRAKYLVGRTDRGIAVVSHLGMTGQWVRDPGDRRWQCIHLRLAPTTGSHSKGLPGPSSGMTGSHSNGPPGLSSGMTGSHSNGPPGLSSGMTGSHSNALPASSPGTTGSHSNRLPGPSSGMTGSHSNEPPTNEPPSAVALISARRLVRLWVVSEDELPSHPRLAPLGPDPWPGRKDGGWLRRRVGDERATPLKSRLLDQARVGGLGNIAVVEACHRAGLHPHAPVNALGAATWDRLATAIHDHITQVLADEAGDEIDYVNLGGDNPFLVYGREGEPCPRCAAAGQDVGIVRVTLAGRSSWFCPRCQPGDPRNSQGATS